MKNLSHRMAAGIVGVAVALVAIWGLAPVVVGQTFPIPVAQAITLLTTGVTPFTTVGMNASGYINWGTARGAAGYGIRDNAGVIQFKGSGGSWTNLPVSAQAPDNATYITQTPNGSLSAEQALSTLGSALLVNTTGTGVLSAYGGSTCTNQVMTAVSALGVATCASVDLATLPSGVLPVANGGTAATTLTGVLQGNGAGAFTATTSSTVGQVLRVTGANTYAWGAVNFADADAITGTVPVANGGTGLTSGTSGGVLAFTAAGTLASSAALTANRLVLGGGAGVAPTVLGSLGTTTTVLHGNAAGAPSFAAVNITNDTTGNLASSRGGTDQTSYTIGDLLYASGATALSKLADVTAGSFLRSGGVGAAPVYSTTTWPNSATAGDLLQASAPNTYANLPAVAAGSYLRSAGVATPSVWSTLVLPNSATTGDVLIATGANTVGSLAAVATGRLMISQGVGTAPVWSTTPTADIYTAVTAFTGPGTAAAAGSFRLANNATVSAKNAGGAADIVLIQSSVTDRVVLGNANASGFTFTGTSGSLRWEVTAPTISAGFGAAPSIAGIASAFKVTIGGGGAANGVVLFNATWATAPVCVGNNETTSNAVRATPTVTQVTLTGTFTAADVVAVYCIGY